MSEKILSEDSTLFSHKDEKTSLFSEDKVKCVRENSLTPVFEWKSALKIFPMFSVKTVCIEVALLLSHRDEETSLSSEDKLKSLRIFSLTPVFKWKSATKFFRMMTVKTVCIEVAIFISHKDQKISLFSENQIKL